MIKLNKKIIGVFIVLLLLLGFYTYKSFSNVEAGSDQTGQSVPTTCTDDNKDQLNMHYGVQVKWSNDKKSVQISSQHGVFRINEFNENTKNKLTKELVKDGYYYKFADGSESVASPDKNITLTFSEGIDPGDEVEIGLALAEPSTPCGSYGDFMASGQTSGSYYATGLMEIAIPVVDVHKKIDNTQFNSELCRGLRDDAASSFYSQALAYCFQEKVDYNFSDTELEEMVNLVRKVYASLQINITSPYVTGKFNKGWTINDERFDQIRTEAINRGNAYDVDNGKWYKYTSGEPPADSYTTAIFGCRKKDDDIYYITWCEPDNTGYCYATQKNGTPLPDGEKVPRSGSGLTYCDDTEDKNIIDASVSLKCNNKPILYDDTDPTNPLKNDFSNLYMYYYVNNDGTKSYTNVASDVPEGAKLVYNVGANTEYYYAKAVEVEKNYKLEWDGVTKTAKSQNMSDAETCKADCQTKGGEADDIAACKEQCDIRNRDHDVCNRTCEEAVEIEYGPPIASQAGFCFEYQIQVTSRVKCSGNVTAEFPKLDDSEVCTPVPYCNTIPGYVHQAGPNTEYEKCISNCDGGKYTSECSENCYNKVYGKESLLDVAKTAFRKVIPSAQKLETCGLFDGSYEISSDGTISWKKGSNCDNNTYARYYLEYEEERTRSDHGINKYLPFDGFKKHVSNSAVTCSNVCSFSGCGTKDFLNREDAAKYYSEQVKQYSNAVTACLAAASCTTKTATFTIKASYKDGDGSVKTINYPYSTPDKKDELASTSAKKVDTSEEKCSDDKLLSYLSDSNPHTLINYGGCYENSCGGIDEYHAHWSFPGTYRNRKSHNYTYVDKTGDRAWTSIPDKFCLLNEAQSQNEGWWKRFHLHYGIDDIPSKADDSSEAKEYYKECAKNATFEVNDWNIEGETNDFGYFGWKINVKCFYATPCNSNSETCSDKCTGSTSPRTRSVDLKQLFPQNDGTIPGTSGAGESGSTPSESGGGGAGESGSTPSGSGGGGAGESGSTPSASGATVLNGRTPGFNWSVYAKNEKIPNNISLPSEYQKQVSDLGYDVYNNDEHLDYEFYLTPELIGKIRDKIKNDNITYRDFNMDNAVDINGVDAYLSSLFRNSGGTLGGLFEGCSKCKIPKRTVLGCFNIQNYNADKCEPVDSTDVS